MRRFILGAQLGSLDIIDFPDREKTSFRPQNGPRSLGTEKLLKVVNCQKTILS
jgi:hypothetical protein